MFEEECLISGPTTRIIAKMYAIQLAAHSDHMLPFWDTWERDLGKVLSEEKRNKIVHQVLQISMLHKISGVGLQTVK